MLLILGIITLVAIVGAAVLLGGRAPGSTISRPEAERLANLEAERLLGQRYRDGEITMEEFERDLAGILARRERRDGTARP